MIRTIFDRATGRCDIQSHTYLLEYQDNHDTTLTSDKQLLVRKDKARNMAHDSMKAISSSKCLYLIGTTKSRCFHMFQSIPISAQWFQEAMNMVACRSGYL